MFYNRKRHWISSFYHGTYRFLYPAPVPSAQILHPFVYLTVRECDGLAGRTSDGSLLLCGAENLGVSHLPNIIIKHTYL